LLADKQLALNAGWDETLLAAELAAFTAGGFQSRPDRLWGYWACPAVSCARCCRGAHRWRRDPRTLV